MRLTFFILFIILGINVLSQTQQTMLPIKVDHKWGFINESGEVIVTPTYDAISQDRIRWNRGFPAQSRFRLVELNDKLGIIDGTGREILPPAYEAIRPLNDSLFAVQIDSLFTLVNRNGEILMEDRFDDIRLMKMPEGLSDEFFMVLEGKKWGVFHRTDGLLFPPKFGDIIFIDVGRGYFVIKNDREDKVWGLMNRQGDKVLDFEYETINILHPNFVAARKTERDFWAAWDSLGNELLEEKWWSLVPLNKHLVALKEKKTWWSLFVFNDKKIIEYPRGTEGFKPLNDIYAQSLRGGKYGFVDTLGVEIVPPQFEEILTAPPPLFRVKNRYWGLFTVEDKTITPFKYQAIGEFEDGLAIAMQNDLMGMLNLKGEETIPTKYDNFQNEDAYLKAFNGTTMMLYEMSDSGTVISEDFFPEVYSMKVGYDLETQGMAFSMSSVRAAAREGRGNQNRVRPPVLTFSDEWDVENSRWQFKLDDFSDKYYLWDKNKKKATTRPDFQSVRHIRNTNLSLVFHADKTVLNALSVKAVYPVDTASLAAIFSHDKGKFITSFNMMGLRRGDFENGFSYAVFIDKNGKYGLINKDGKVLEKVANKKNESLEFDFIGKFENGLARFCIGGRLESVEEKKDDKIAVDHFNRFNRDFLVTPSRRMEMLHVRKFMMANQEGNEPLWGYLDTLGRVVIEPQFDFANNFLDSIAVNKKDGKWGLINKKNETLINFEYAGITRFINNTWKLSKPNDKPIFFNKMGHEVIGLKYSKFGGFNDGMCRVKVDSLWGFVNDLGDEVIPCEYEDARNFSEGLAAVKKAEDWIFIDKSGQEILNPNEHIVGIVDLGKFNNGLCWYKVGEMYGFLNRKGEIAIERNFTKAFDFQFGVARAVLNAKTGLLDVEGNWILMPKDYEAIFKFNELGLAEVRRHFKKEKGLINTKGELVTEIKYSHISEFVNGHATVIYKGLNGLIDTTGREILSPMYANIKEVQSGLVAVMLPRKLMWHFRTLKDERAFKGDFQIVENFNQGVAFIHEHEYDEESKGWINTEGKLVNPVPNHNVHNYSEGLFGMYDPRGSRRFGKQMHYYFCDKNGRNIFNRHFEDIEAFENGTAAFEENARWGVLNRFGMMPISPKYARISHLSNNLIHVKPNILFGLAENDGTILFDAQFDRIDSRNDLIKVESGEQIGYLDDDWEWVWDLQK